MFWKCVYIAPCADMNYFQNSTSSAPHLKSRIGSQISTCCGNACALFWPHPLPTLCIFALARRRPSFYFELLGLPSVRNIIEFVRFLRVTTCGFVGRYRCSIFPGADIQFGRNVFITRTRPLMIYSWRNRERESVCIALSLFPSFPHPLYLFLYLWQAVDSSLIASLVSLL